MLRNCKVGCLLFLFLLILSGSAFADCKASSPKELQKSTDLIFVGKLASVSKNIFSFLPFISSEIQFREIEVLTGSYSKSTVNIDLYNGHAQQQFIDNINNTFLVFVNENADGHFYFKPCATKNINLDRLNKTAGYSQSLDYLFVVSEKKPVRNEMFRNVILESWTAYHRFKIVQNVLDAYKIESASEAGLSQKTSEKLRIMNLDEEAFIKANIPEKPEWLKK